METKASYALVGGFVLFLAFALFATVIWLARASLNEESQQYRIFFTGSVTGLVEGSTVRYRGVSVGTVTDVRIDPQNVEQVRVTIEVPADTPVKTDAVATLEPVGVTGGVYVEIQGGSQDAPLLRQSIEEVPTIQSRSGAISELLMDAPRLLSRLIFLAENLAGFLTPENQDAIAKLLGNLAIASGDIVTTADATDKLVTDLRKHVNTIGGQTESLLANIDRTVVAVGGNAEEISGELARTSEDLRLLTQSMVTTAEQVSAMVAENREPIRDFTHTALYDMSLLMVEMRELAQSMGRVTARLENDPTNFLFGASKDGVQVK